MPMMSSKNLLIGSCGGLTGVYLSRVYSHDFALRVSGADSNPDSVGRFFVDAFHHLPSTASEAYIGSLISLLNEGDFDLYIPTHSSETRIVSRYEDEIRRHAPYAKFIVCPFDTFEALDDKLLVSESLSSKGIPTPRLISMDELSEAAYPIFIKKRFGSGGKGSMIVGSPALMSALLLEQKDVIGFEYINGTELTIDCMFDTTGRLISYNQRRRVKTLGGAAIVTKNDFSIDTEPFLKLFEENWVFRGCVNFQCIIKEGIPYFTDVNLRFPSGGMPLSVESGVNIPEMLLKLLGGEECDPSRYTSDRKPRTMYRYFDEIFEVVS